MIAGATLSGSNGLSAALVGLGLVGGIWPVWTVRNDPIVRLVVIAAIAWLVYGAIVGSLPRLDRLRQIERWATTEGRILVALATTAIASAVTTVRQLRWVLAAACAIVTVLHTIALAIYVAGVDVPVFAIELRGLFFGFASSHHVVAFLSAGVALVVLAVPDVARGWWRWTTLAIALASIVLSGSRTSLLGLVAGAVVIAWYRVGRRQFWQVCAVGVVALLAIVAMSDRFRTTARSAVDPDFLRSAYDVFVAGDSELAVARSSSEAEANALLRLSYWGEAAQDVVNSPVVGMGAFRQNDERLEFSGVSGVVLVATDGRNRFNDSEPHNVVLYLLQETGIAGLALYSAPYVLAWRRVGARRDPGVEPDTESESELEIDHEGRPVGLETPVGRRALARGGIAGAAAMSMVSSGVLATGLGVIANTVIFGTAAVAAAATRAAAGTTDADNADITETANTSEPRDRAES
jgi:hypothetical protein